jgi:sigma-B regulation protein RsbU (phosphoserine phosphatase)
MYSNGLTEAVNSGKKHFGTERLINLVINNRTGSASQILDAAAKELGDFSRNHPLQADVTLLIIKRS